MVIEMPFQFRFSFQVESSLSILNLLDLFSLLVVAPQL